MPRWLRATKSRRTIRCVIRPIDESGATKALVGTEPYAAVCRQGIRRRNSVHQARAVRVAADRFGRPSRAEVESERCGRLGRERERRNHWVVRAGGSGRDWRQGRKGEVGGQGRSTRRASPAMIGRGEREKWWRRSGRNCAGRGTQRGHRRGSHSEQRQLVPRLVDEPALVRAVQGRMRFPDGPFLLLVRIDLDNLDNLADAAGAPRFRPGFPVGEGATVVVGGKLGRALVSLQSGPDRLGRVTAPHRFRGRTITGPDRGRQGQLGVPASRRTSRAGRRGSGGLGLLCRGGRRRRRGWDGAVADDAVRVNVEIVSFDGHPALAVLSRARRDKRTPRRWVLGESLEG